MENFEFLAEDGQLVGRCVRIRVSGYGLGLGLELRLLRPKFINQWKNENLRQKINN
jgi:hypothetical protein